MLHFWPSFKWMIVSKSMYGMPPSETKPKPIKVEPPKSDDYKTDMPPPSPASSVCSDHSTASVSTSSLSEYISVCVYYSIC